MNNQSPQTQTIVYSILFIILLAAVGYSVYTYTAQKPTGQTQEVVEQNTSSTSTSQPGTTSGKTIVKQTLLKVPNASSFTTSMCAKQKEQETVIIVLGEELREPRCQLVTQKHKLAFTNEVNSVQTVGFERLPPEAQQFSKVSVNPGQTYVFDKLIGDYLADGMHKLYVNGSEVFEIMVVASE